DWIGSSPAIGSDGTIYVGSSDYYFSEYSYLHAINPDGTLKWKYQTGGLISSSPAIGSDGTIYFGNGTIIRVGSRYESGSGKLYAIQSSSFGLANSPWPKFRRDSRNTGRYGN
ncbi:MAG: PQQ-binding-like beta-propeller repeat protein, partial [Fervidobacterium sp.]